jgi:AraC family L-rhamnose operon transcriptional activator RhaR
MSPLAYLRQMRVQKMAQLLLGTDLSIAEVARAVGWKDPSYATRCFHAAYGVSPTAYRHQHAPVLDTLTVSPSPEK